MHLTNNLSGDFPSRWTGEFYMNMKKVFEVVGGLLLLGSFTVQNFLYDKWDEREKLIRQGITERSILDKGAIIFENLYFAANDCNGYFNKQQVAELKRQFINQAAVKNSYGLMFPIVTSDMSKQKKTEITNKLTQLASSVGDFQSFSNYILETGNIMKDVESPNDVLTRVSGNRDTARMLFLALNMAGSITLLIGICLRNKGDKA